MCSARHRQPLVRHRPTTPLLVAFGVVMTALVSMIAVVAASGSPARAATASTSCPRLGVYNGGPDYDSAAASQFGATPEVSNSYVQPTQRIAITKETNRILRGTSPNITITTKGTNYIEVLGTGPTHPDWPEASAWLTRYVDDLSTLANVDPSVPVYGTIEHEFKVKVRTGAVTGASADPAVYGRALNRFYQLAHAKNPLIRTSYWFAGFDRTVEGAVADRFVTLPKAIMFDPYASDGTESVTSIASQDVAWVRSQDWYVGQEIGLSEFGAKVGMGDLAMADFFTDVRSQLAKLGISFAVLFNRVSTFDTQIAGRTDGRTFPRAVGSFSYEAQHTGACSTTATVAACPELGVYGDADPDKDTDAVRQFGKAPQVANSYYLPSQRIAVARETARINRGTSPNIALSTAGTNYIEVLANGPTDARYPAVADWLGRYLDELSTLARVNPAVPVYVTLESAFRYKIKSGQVTGPSADPLVYGRALNRFFQLVNAKNPALRTSYWMAGWDRPLEGEVATRFTTLPEAILFNRYTSADTDTISRLTTSQVTWIRSQQWYAGQEIAVAELAGRVVMGDAALGRLYTGLRDALGGSGISWAVLMNKTLSTRIVDRSDGQTYPLARAAFSASLQATC